MDTPPAAALAAETTPAADLRPWLATLGPDDLIGLVLEAAERDLDFRRRLHLSSQSGHRRDAR